MSDRANAVIVGGGIIGCAIGYALALKGMKDILLLERDALGTGTTGRSLGGMRHYKNDLLSAAYSAAGCRRHQMLEEELGAPTDFRTIGSLGLYSDHVHFDRALGTVAELNSRGIGMDVLRPSEISRIAPYLETSDLVGGIYCRDDARADPYAVIQGYRLALHRLGVRVLEGTEVTGILVEQERVVGVKTQDGNIGTNLVVNAAGPYDRIVCSMVDVDLPTTPSKRQAFVFSMREPRLVEGPWIVDDTEDMHLMPDPVGMIVIRGIPAVGVLDTRVQWEQLEEIALSIMKRAPILAKAGVRKAWVGIRSFSKDGYPVLGYTSRPAGFFCAVGWGRSGFCWGPVVGQLAAEMMVEGRASTLDVSWLSPARYGL